MDSRNVTESLFISPRVQVWGKDIVVVRAGMVHDHSAPHLYGPVPVTCFLIELYTSGFWLRYLNTIPEYCSAQLPEDGPRIVHCCPVNTQLTTRKNVPPFNGYGDLLYNASLCSRKHRDNLSYLFARDLMFEAKKQKSGEPRFEDLPAHAFPLLFEYEKLLVLMGQHLVREQDMTLISGLNTLYKRTYSFVSQQKTFWEKLASSF